MRIRRRSDGHEITCRQAVGLVTDYLDGTLHGADRRRFETHLFECGHCSEHVKQIALTVAVTRRIRVADIDPAARADLLVLYRRWRDDRGLQPS